MSSSERVTHLLAQLKAGDASAGARLVPLVYTELHGLARAIFAAGQPGSTLQPTALIHEAWLKLAGHLDSIEDRRHFLVVAGKAMRQVIVNHARERRAQKRGGHLRRVTFNASEVQDGKDGFDLIAFDDCLSQLAERNPRHAQIAELRLLSGLTIDETAATLGLAPRTVDADWAMAKAWLTRALGEHG